MTKATILVLACVLLVPVAGLAVPVAVDCVLGPITSINAALATAGPSLEITITGPCTEDVIVTRDNVLLAGSVAGVPASTVITAAGADVNAEGATVLIRDARRVELRDLTISGGPFAGVLATQAQDDIVFETLVLSGNGRWGAYLYNGANVRAMNITASGNGGAAGGGPRGGFFIADAGNLSCFACAIDNSAVAAADYGVRIHQAGSLSFLAGSSIVAGGDYGISSTDGRVSVDNSTVTGDLYGVFSTNSAITLRNDSTITGTGLAAVRGTGTSDIRVTGGTLTSPARSLSLLDNSDGKITGVDAKTLATLDGSIEVSGMSRVQLFRVDQTTNPVGNTASQNSYVRSVTTILVGSTTLSEFATALFSTSGTLGGTLSCNTGGDAFCSGGTTFSSSTCGSCP